MSASSLDYLVLRAPTYTGDSRLSGMLDAAETEVGTCFGDNRYKAVALLALHRLAMDDAATQQGLGSTGGALTLKQEGSLRLQFTVDFSLQHKYPDLTMTRWGMEYLGLMRRSILSPMTRMTQPNGNLPFYG